METPMLRHHSEHYNVLSELSAHVGELIRLGNPLTPKYTEVTQEVLLETPQHKQFFSAMLPLYEIKKIERMEWEEIVVSQWPKGQGAFRITLKRPVEGKLNIEGKENDFIQDAEKISESGRKYLELCKQTHVKWDQEITVSLFPDRICFIDSSLNCKGLNIHWNMHGSIPRRINPTSVLSDVFFDGQTCKPFFNSSRGLSIPIVEFPQAELFNLFEKYVSWS